MYGKRYGDRTAKKVIEEVKGKTQISVNWYCYYLGFSRQSFYQWKKRQKLKADDEERILAKVIELCRDQPRIGTRKLHYLLPSFGLSIGRDALFCLLKRY